MEVFTFMYNKFQVLYNQHSISCHLTSTAFTKLLLYMYRGSSWSWSYGGWIYNYLCNQCLSSL